MPEEAAKAGFAGLVPFNSLFEMHQLLEINKPAPILLSILYLRCAQDAAEAVRITRAVLSILYLRCSRATSIATAAASNLLTFNSLFEMPFRDAVVLDLFAGVCLSILYLRCRLAKQPSKVMTKKTFQFSI